jgi:hypothetical protein
VLQQQTAAVYVSPALLDYLQLLVEATRKEQRSSSMA